MKWLKVLVPICLLVVFLGMPASSVLADDPPDIAVNVEVVTPGDVDLDVGIEAGGDVNVTVDGVDLQQTASTADAAYSGLESLQNQYQKNQTASHVMADYVYYWERTGIGPMIEGQIAELQGAATLLIEASAKLIKGQDLNRGELVRVQYSLTNLGKRDTEIWDQLMYGAEAHIALLEEAQIVQEANIASLQKDTANLQAKLSLTESEHTALLNYVDYLQRQYLYYFWILGGVVLALLGSILVLLKRRIY